MNEVEMQYQYELVTSRWIKREAVRAIVRKHPASERR